MKSFGLLFVLLVAGTSVMSQIRNPEIVWQKTFGGSKNDDPAAIVATADGGFILGGATVSTDGDVTPIRNSNWTDIWLIKIDNAGNKIWEKCLGGSLPEVLYSLIPASDGGYIAYGETASSDWGSAPWQFGTNLFVLKFDENGNVIWKVIFGAEGNERGGNIRATEDGGYIVAASTNSLSLPEFHPNPSFEAWDIYLFKISKDGNLLWHKCLGNIYDQRVVDIMAIPGNRYVLTAAYATANLSQLKPIRFTLDSVGRTIDSAFYLNPSPNNTYEMGPLYRVGTTDTIGHAINYQKSNIAACFNRTIRGVKFGNTSLESIMCTPNSDSYRISQSSQIVGYGTNLNIAVGETDDTALMQANRGISDAFFTILDNHGRIYARRAFGGSSADNFVAIAQMSADEFIALGRTYSNDQEVSGNHGGSDFWIVKLRIPPASNLVRGRVFYDRNANGVKDNDENYYTGALVKSVKAGVRSLSSIASDGAFSNAIDTGLHITSLLFNQQYHTVVPISRESNFSTFNNTDSVDFAIQLIPGKKDLEITLIPVSAVRPGFESTYRIVYKNAGTEPLSATVSLVKDPRQTFMSAWPVQTAIVNDSISWNLGTLQPFDTGFINIRLRQVSPPQLMNGDTVTLRTEISPIAGDETLLNNQSSLLQRVTGSYDPNEKSERNSGAITATQVASREDLVYTILFQNTGTDTAFNIRILDTIDSKLDASTISLVATSHPYTFSISEDKYLTWTFRDILLPDSNVNEPLSHGFITYRIKPLSTVATGNVIRNSASIYFDYNTPIRTNTHETIVKPPAPLLPVVSGLLAAYCSNLGIQKGKIQNLPAAGSGTTVVVKLDATVLPVAADSTFSFDVNALAAGNHTIEISYANSTATKTFTHPFVTTNAVTPDVNLSANITNITNLALPVVVTAANAAGGGSAPLYTFARDRNFNTIVQTEGPAITLNINPATLTVGDNWIYVKMKSNASCVTASLATDSIKLTRDMTTGIIDPDNPGRAITPYPNPVTNQLYISGLSVAKRYSIYLTNVNGQVILKTRILNRSNTELLLQQARPGIYLLTIFDDSRVRLLGTIKIIKK
jgi:uncharacterized repeat protein (TIGR01451 family)